MPLVRPLLVALDSATVAKVARDYWSTDKASRDKARDFVLRLRDRGVYIGLTFMHVLELLRHRDESIAHDRLRFLRGLPLIAWLRPYDGSWFPGAIPDLLRRELHAVVHNGKREWTTIIEHVRPTLWETGLGSEMFVENDSLWSIVRSMGQDEQLGEQYVASVARTDPGHVNGITVAEIRKWSIRPKSERVEYMRRFVTTMKTQLEQHGDRRLQNPLVAAVEFASELSNDMGKFEAAGGDPIERILEFSGVPPDLVTDAMTVGDVGELAVYVKQLRRLSERLRPRIAVTVHDAPPDTLPSYVLTRALATIQQRAPRVSGSDFGDGHIAPLILYADGVEVDKRTYEYLRQAKRAHPQLAEVMGHFFKSADYSEIPDRCVGAN